MSKQYNRFEEMRTKIGDYILKNGLVSGDRLPSIGEFSTLMGASSSVIREVLRTFETIGIVSIVNGRGVYIANPNLLKQTDQNIHFELDRAYIIDLIALRRLLEREAIRLAIEQASQDEIAELEAAARALMVNFYSGKCESKYDTQFHNTLYMLAHNRAFISFQKMCDKAFAFLSPEPGRIYDPYAESLPWHWDLYLAIRKRNLEEALQIGDRITENTLQITLNLQPEAFAPNEVTLKIKT